MNFEGKATWKLNLHNIIDNDGVNIGNSVIKTYLDHMFDKT